MKRRICLVGIALSVGPLALLAGNATTASAKSKSTKTAGHTVKCSTKTTIAVANGDTNVLPPVAKGADYGTAHCGGPLGGGVESDSFNVPLSGDTLAKFTMYFGAGTVHGTYDLTPQAGDLNTSATNTTTTFTQTNWMGTMKVKGGSGAYKGDTGTGTMKCSSADGIHISCTDKLKLK
ncbi:MAG: hypothetical protein WAK93_13955 [Solirubrobacteraceae bacterium]